MSIKQGLLTLLAVATAGMTIGAEMPTIGSPLELKLGSNEMAVRHPKAVEKTHSISYYGPREETEAVTNWYGQMRLKLAKPYHLFKSVNLSLTADGNKLFEYALETSCPSNMTRTACLAEMRQIAADLEKTYGVSLSVEERALEDEVRQPKRRVFTFADAQNSSADGKLRVWVFGMVYGRGAMRIMVHVTDTELEDEARGRKGRFFEGLELRSPAKARVDRPVLVLPLGYRFGDVFTNAVDGAVEAALTNWPSHSFSFWKCRGGRVVPIAGTWKGFGRGFFRLTDYGRIEELTVTVETNAVGSTEALSTWAEAVLAARRPGLGLSMSDRGGHFIARTSAAGDGLYFRGGLYFRYVNDVNVSAEARRTKDGQAMLRLTLESSVARKLDQNRRTADGAALRRTVKDLYGMDFDEVKANTPERGAWEWRPLPTSCGAFKEECQSWQRTVLTNPMDRTVALYNASLRHVYDGDVTKAALEAEYRQVVRDLEAKIGVSLAMTRERTPFVADAPSSDGPRAFGDMGSYGLNPAYSCKVGDMTISVRYALPQYEKDGDTYKLTVKGGLMLTVRRERP